MTDIMVSNWMYVDTEPLRIWAYPPNARSFRSGLKEISQKCGREIRNERANIFDGILYHIIWVDSDELLVFGFQVPFSPGAATKLVPLSQWILNI